MEGRVLGIDYGRARIGLALSDPLGITAQPLGMVEVTRMEAAIDRIAALVPEHDVRAIVVGLPLNMDGSEGEMAAETRAFSSTLARKTSLTPVEWDERLTSCQAVAALSMQGKSWRKRRQKKDTVAAQVMLQSYLDSIGR